MYLYALQRFDEAMVEARRAQQLDPASPEVNTWAAAAYLLAGGTEEGMASVQKVLDLDPSYADATLLVARTDVAHGKYSEAIAQLHQALALQRQKDPALLGALGHAYARGGQRREALQVVEELKRMEGRATPFAFIWVYAGLGDNDHAFAWLEQAYAERRDRMAWLNVDPLLDGLRFDPRFDDLVRRVGLPVKSRPPSQGSA